MMGIVRNRKWFYLFSGLLVLGSIISLLIPPALRPGIDFTGGAAVTVHYDQEINAARISEALAGAGHSGAIVQNMGENRFFIRLGELTLDQRDSEGNVTVPGEESRVRETLASLGSSQIENFETVSGTVGAENVRNAAVAILAALGVILLYVSWAFRRVSHPIRFGTVAVIALLHDIIIVLGLFSILGKTMNLEVNAMFITGILLLIGYSINDSIVIFDRVRENAAKYAGAPMSELVAVSMRETIGRSLNTSLTLLIVVMALMLFASESIMPLLYVTAASVTVGAYSSIFIACLLLVSWENGELGKLFSWLPGRRRRRALA